ncbi:pimeloyl-ACP methyl ester carboxylesterase [Limnobacter thiooxidans]|uniref:Alpha/beta fold hydrolase n=1 Tax=Limnobacter thiooxidans TaxID=131080 RepID=A0AA86MB74_9BURK|nr:pimeloyl-ACP methyl ester carboxylesterase [Limnobacter thiooxidans]BET25978.1 alpha/beta fold hydrolase [Limnobacter thiooxidans]
MIDSLMNWICRKLIDSKCKQMGLTKHAADTVDGRTVYFKGGQGPDMVLLHGFGANKENWLALAPRLMRHYTVWVPDLIGFGESDRPANARFHIAAQAERVVRWLDCLGVKSFHVMGNSMGGYMAGALAANFPNRVLSACLLNPAGVNGAEHTAIGQAFAESGKIILAPTTFQEYEHIIDLCFNGKAPPMPGFMRKYFGRMSIQNKALLDRVFMEFVIPDANVSLNDMVASTPVPLMVVWGDSDLLVHSSGLALLKQAQPAIHDLMLENTGHCPMVDRASQVYKAHLAFMPAS